MKDKIINLIKIVFKNYLPIFIIGFLIPMSIFNMISGAFFSGNTWQTTTGVFEMLFAIEFWSNRFSIETA